MSTNKKTIGIWFGGCSSEYKVSLESASAVIAHINREKYELVLIGIDQGGDWYLYEGPVEAIAADQWCHPSICSPAMVSPQKHLHGLLVFRENGVERISLDAALPVLHGKNGEDGTIQGLLELAGIELLGCNTLSSAVCMEKDMAHRLAAAAGVNVPKSYLFSFSEVRKELEAYKAENRKVKAGIGELVAAEKRTCPQLKLWDWAKELGYPLFVKPLRAGSSFGITKVTEPRQLYEAVEQAFCHDSLCIMEEAIDGFEVGCAVLGNPRGEAQDLFLGEVDEIELSDGFFDYTEKYTLKTSQIHVPARISREKAQEIKETACKIYQALDCEYFARVDLFLTPQGEIYFNEVNTIPGFTAHSRYPSMMKAAGISFEELLDRLLNMVFLKGYEEK